MLQNITYLTRQPKIFIPIVLKRSRKTCPGAKPKYTPPAGETAGVPSKCQTIAGDPTEGGSDNKGQTKKHVLKRAIESGKCRMGLIPEEWFLFLKPMTGVSGPYFLMIGLANYLVSKEIYVMDHEYYLGLSVVIVLYYLSTSLGKTVGAVLDKEVDAVVRDLEKNRIDDVASYNAQIKDLETAIWRVEGQKDLINAKKENILVQIEAIFRERQMMVYKGVQRRMDFYVKRYWLTRRIKQKWMAQWVLQKVKEAITPEFKKLVLDNAIRDFANIADKVAASSKK